MGFYIFFFNSDLLKKKKISLLSLINALKKGLGYSFDLQNK